MEAKKFFELIAKSKEGLEERIGLVELLRLYGWNIVGAKTFAECVERIRRLGFADVYAEYVCHASMKKGE